MHRFGYQILGVVLLIAGFGVGALSIYLDAGNHYNAITLGQNNIIQIGTSSPALSLLIFAAGASFSSGIAVFLFLLQPTLDAETQEDDEEEWGPED